jgi:small subunit ribosomal protein S21e
MPSLILFSSSSVTNRLITAKDHASVQFNIAHVDANGVFTGETTPIALCGFVREKGDSDDGINRLLTRRGFLRNVANN